MSAPTPYPEHAITDAIEAFPAPEGFEWCVVHPDQYDAACVERSLPTLYVECFDGETVHQYHLVGQHDLAPEVTR